MPKFTKDLGQPDALNDKSIAAAQRLFEDGRLFRYGEVGKGVAETGLLEEEFAAITGRSFALGVNSGGCALFLAMKASGVGPGEKVLVNGFTLAPVPGAIEHAGAEAVLVEINDELTIDCDDLDAKATATGAKFLLLSYMRGHLADMDKVMAVVRKHDLILIEDCAHATKAFWGDQMIGTFGAVGCFSMQTFKHLNSGEGGVLVFDDEDIAAKAILLSGTYMLYEQHTARPSMEVFERHKYNMPNCSMRMSNLVAAILRPQLPELASRIAHWDKVYDWIGDGISNTPNLRLPKRLDKAKPTPTSIQFVVEDLSYDQIESFLAHCADQGLHIKWFGAVEPVGFTSRPSHWHYVEGGQEMQKTDAILRRVCDIRTPPSLQNEDCLLIGEILVDAMEATVSFQ
jgi:dTDP-4-amino-4,6-dideoxygalactose transaminase